MLVEILFWSFSAVLVGAALGVILSRNPVHSVLYLVLCFFNAAVLWLLIEAEFLAIVLVLVYVGAVMVLFLFVTMMLDIREATLQRFLPRSNLPALAMLVLLGVEMLALVALSDRFSKTKPVAEARTSDEVRELSTTLFAEYLLPFEVASVILLVALIGAVVLARKEPG